LSKLITVVEAINFLRSTELSNEVEEIITMARRAGIKGSPATIIDDKFKLDGVQMKDTFVQVGVGFTPGGIDCR
jgi:predicted DsbA family dithiol-disulfide isomerase